MCTDRGDTACTAETRWREKLISDCKTHAVVVNSAGLGNQPDGCVCEVGLSDGPVIRETCGTDGWGRKEGSRRRRRRRRARQVQKRGVDSERQARVWAKDLIRSSLEKWTLKASVCVWARAGRRSCLSACAERGVTDWEVTPLISVLFSRPRRCCGLWKATKKASTRARSTYDNCVDESLEAALTFKKRATLAFITEEERGAFAARTKRFPLGARDGKASKGQPSKAARPEPQGWNQRARRRWMFSAGYPMLHLWTLSCCPQLKEEKQGYWSERGRFIYSQLIWEETA